MRQVEPEMEVDSDSIAKPPPPKDQGFFSRGSNDCDRDCCYCGGQRDFRIESDYGDQA